MITPIGGGSAEWQMSKRRQDTHAKRAKACRQAPAEYDMAIPSCTIERDALNRISQRSSLPKAAYEFVKSAPRLIQVDNGTGMNMATQDATKVGSKAM